MGPSSAEDHQDGQELKHFLCEERLKGLSLFRLEKRRLWGTQEQPARAYKDVFEKTEPGSSWQ